MSLRAVALREWATPLALGAFFLSAATGLVIFFGYPVGMNKFAHEWLGWALVAGVVLHAGLHWGALKRHLGRPLGQGLVGLFVILFGLSFLPKPEDPNHKYSPYFLASEAMLDAPLSLAVQVAKTDLDLVLTRLRAAGFDPAPDKTLRQIGGALRADRTKALGITFGQ